MSTTPEPLAYKFVGTYWTWICEEYDEDDLQSMQPMYAPIEDEEN